MDKRDIGIIAILFLIAFFIWTIPFHDNRLPFGENDAAWHFAIGDSMYNKGRSIGGEHFEGQVSLECIERKSIVDKLSKINSGLRNEWYSPHMGLPDYIDLWYRNFNCDLGHNAVQYPPPNHLNIAMVQIIGGERFLPTYIYRAVASFLAVFTVYFILRKLYGIFPAFLASFGLIFSIREAMVYLWGQTATLLPITFVPLVLFSFYMYYTSLYEKEKPIYLYMLTFLLAGQYLLHLQGLVVSLAVLPFAFLFLTINHRSLPKINFGHIAACAIIFLLISVPFLPIYAGTFYGQIASEPTIGKLERLKTWGINTEMIQGAFPNFFVEFSSEYSMVLLPFLLLGILFLILRRQDKDVLMLSWFAAMYFILHIDVFIGAAQGRAARMVLAETQIFYALIALGIAFAISFAKENRTMLKFGAAAVFVIIIGATTGKAFYESLDKSYPGIMRLTPEQMEAAGWIDQNFPEDKKDETALIFNSGTITYQKTRWMLAVSRRHVLQFNGKCELPFDEPYLIFHNYFMVDYSDYVKLNWREQAQVLLQKEQQFNLTPIYNRNNIRIYDFKNKTC